MSHIVRILCFAIFIVLIHSDVISQVPGVTDNFKIIKKTADSLYFDNGKTVSKFDLHKLHMYWRFIQDREAQLRSKGKSDYYKDVLWKKYWDSSTHYYNRLPDFIRLSRRDLRKYKDSL